MNPMFFFYLTAGAMLFLVISFLMGHGHDAGHVGHDLGGHDPGDHGGGHGEGSGSNNLSIWSLQVLLLFISGFGIGGYFASISGLSFFITIALAIAGGLALASLGYSIINFFYRRQFDSSIKSDEFIGLTGIIVTSINAGGVGQVRCEIRTSREVFLARSADGNPIPINSVVQITGMVGSTAIVEIADPNRQTELLWRR
jgi:membrane protein implicated in regulation of membrane protease activity